MPPTSECPVEGCTVVQVIANRVKNLEDSEKHHSESIGALYDRIDSLKTWMMTQSAALFLAVIVAIIGYLLKK